MKKSLNKKSGGQEVPDCLEGKGYAQDIVEKFKECYSELYSATNRTEEMHDLNRRIRSLIQNDA